MLVAGLPVLAVVGLILFLFVRYAARIPRPWLKGFGHFMLYVSLIESVLIVWILVYVWNTDWTWWTLSFNDFWREQLAPIYFIKQWLYSWLWNDMLDVLFVFLPALVFLVVRTSFTTYLGIRSLTLAKRVATPD